MASTDKWEDMAVAADLLGISISGVKQKIANGELITQDYGGTIQVLFDFDPKRNPQYLVKKPPLHPQAREVPEVAHTH